MNQLIKKCDICDIETNNYCKNIFEQQTKHTETLIYQYLEKFLGQEEFQKFSNHRTTNIICQNCLIQFNEYDLAIETATRIEKEFIRLIINNQNDVVVVDSYSKIDKDIIDNAFYIKRSPPLFVYPEQQNTTEDNKYYNDISMYTIGTSTSATSTTPTPTTTTIGPSLNTHFINPQRNNEQECLAAAPLESLLAPSTFLKHIKTTTHKKSSYSKMINKSASSTTTRHPKLTKKRSIKSKFVVTPGKGSEKINLIIMPTNNNNNNNVNVKSKPNKINRKEIKKFKYKKRKTVNIADDSGPPYQCTKCDCVYEQKRQLIAHLKLIHPEPIACDICGRTYKSKSALTVHIGMHENISPFVCDICGKKFTQRVALARHMPIHTGVHAYQCDRCGKPFVHSISLRMHLLVHDNIREIKCKICGFELRSNSHLTRHMRVHSGEKPFTCPTCGQKFAQRYNMTTHMKTHQGTFRNKNTIFNCAICTATFTKQIKLDEHLALQHNSCTSSNVKNVTLLTESALKLIQNSHT